MDHVFGKGNGAVPEFVKGPVVNLNNIADLVSQYARAQLYAISSIRKPSDMHLLWGPVHARTRLGIGARNFSLYDLARVPRHTWGDYLVNEPLKARYAAFTSKEARQLADDKTRFFEHCCAHGVRTAPILALITPQQTDARTIPHVYSAQQLAEILTPGQYFLKPSNGSHGEGTFSLKVDAAGLHWDGRHGTHQDFFDYCVPILKHTRALILQPKLVNHQAIRDVTHARGLSTIRVVTFRHEDGILVSAACLRIVVGDSEVDSFSHGQSGNLVAGVDVASGKLITAVGSSSRTWPRMVDVPQHPASKASILDVTVPYWSEVVALVKQAHLSMDGLRTVGWDVAVTEDGPLIVEANWRYDIDLLQVAYKKGFKQVIDQHV